MGDWGLRISKDGTDVKTGDDKDMVLTSKYSVFKGSKNANGSQSVPTDGAVHKYTIFNHGLGYIPIVQGFAYDNYWGITQLPFADFFDNGSMGWDFSRQISADSDNIYLSLYFQPLYGSVPANITVNYYYFLFIDKGKL